MDRQLALVVHNVRSAHNVGSLIRTAEGLGLTKVYLTGYTPYPATANDARLPHVAERAGRQISKTALGAEKSLNWEHCAEFSMAAGRLRDEGYKIAGLEQAKSSLDITEFRPAPKMALVVGREVDGLEQEILSDCDTILEIPMAGQKESFNVAAAAAMALYHLKFFSGTGG